jgi:hypothetical protein
MLWTIKKGPQGLRAFSQYSFLQTFFYFFFEIALFYASSRKNIDIQQF